jgi:hypothetical protein
MIRAAAIQNAKYPQTAESPNQIAAAPPGKPMSERVWPANVCFREEAQKRRFGEFDFEGLVQRVVEATLFER